MTLKAWSGAMFHFHKIFFLLNGQTLMPSFFDCVEKSSCPASSQQQALKKFGLIFYCNVILK